jgi:NADH dehydrogenase
MSDNSAATRTVLLAGGTGFVGEGLRHALGSAGHTVRLLVRSRKDAERMEAMGFETALGNVLDAQSLVIAINGVDAVVNLVAVIEESGEATFERMNYQGTANLVDAARQAGVRRFIQMSALGAANLPAFPYRYTKWRAENYVQDRALDWTIFRPSIVFGESVERHIQLVGQLAAVVRAMPVIPVAGSGTTRFQPIHRDDVAACFARVIDEPASIGRTFEIAGPEVVTYREIVDEIADTLGTRKPRLRVPIPLVQVGVRVMDALPFMDPPVTIEQLKMLQIDNTTSANAARELLGRPPKPFRGNLDFLRDPRAADQGSSA